MVFLLRNFLIFGVFLLLSNCKANSAKENNIFTQEKAIVLIPFHPGDCHNCNQVFYKNLEILDLQKINFSFVIPENMSDDLDFIKKEYNLDKYNNNKFIFSNLLFDKYKKYEQSFVMQYGIDSNYKIFNNAEDLFMSLEELNNVEKLDLGSYKPKKSTLDFILKNTNQMCFLNELQTHTFDYLNLNGREQIIKQSFSEEQLLKNFLLYFKDSTIARRKLVEINSIEDVPKKNNFYHFEFNEDSLFVSSNHTFVENIKDSILGGFYSINIYNNGLYVSSRGISEFGLPKGYVIVPRFHVYNNDLYLSLYKDQFEKGKPNYFIAKFELNDDTYRFKKMLNFSLPDVYVDIGYTFVGFGFSGKYMMTAVSNVFYDLESEKEITLNIPFNKHIETQKLFNNFKGTDLIITNLNVKYPNALITYYSNDDNDTKVKYVLNYDLSKKCIIGKIQMPFSKCYNLKPDLSRFGYYTWMPEENNLNYWVYKKLF